MNRRVLNDIAFYKILKEVDRRGDPEKKPKGHQKFTTGNFANVSSIELPTDTPDLATSGFLAKKQSPGSNARGVQTSSLKTMKKCIKDFGIPNLNNEILSSVKKNIDHVVLCNFKSMKKTQKFRFFPDKEYLNYKLKEKIMDSAEDKRMSLMDLKSNSQQLLKTVYSQYM